MDEGMVLTCFQIISQVGKARSNYIEAIKAARSGDFDEAQNLIDSGNECFIEGHNIHAEILTKEANGEATDVSVFLIHAEDQLMSAEDFKILATEFIELYKTIYKK